MSCPAAPSTLPSDANRVLANGTNFLIHVLSGGTLKETATGLNEGGSTVEFRSTTTARSSRPPAGSCCAAARARRRAAGRTAPPRRRRSATRADTNRRRPRPADRHGHDGVQRRHGNAVTIPTELGGAAVGLRPGVHLPARAERCRSTAPAARGTLTSNGGNRGRVARTLTVTGATTSPTSGTCTSRAARRSSGHDDRDAGTVMSGSVLELAAATTLNASSASTPAASTSPAADADDGRQHEHQRRRPAARCTSLSGGTLVRNDRRRRRRRRRPDDEPGHRSCRRPGGLRFNDDVTQTGGVTQVDALLSMQFGNTFKLQGGTLKGTGTIENDVDNSGGTVAAGTSPGAADDQRQLHAGGGRDAGRGDHRDGAGGVRPPARRAAC